MTHPKESPEAPPPGGGRPNEHADATDADELETLSRQLADAETNLAGMRETLLRERADLENQRKRMQRDLEQTVKFANEKLLRELLPVYDGLESGLTMEAADVASMREGLVLTLKSLLKIAESNGLQEIDPVGQPLDPERHHAVSVVEAPGSPSGTVVGVMQKGYVLNGRLLRPALVTVAK
ncbi:MAG TPA: nucleotide exchange factor GrpE [Rhodanobacteraceae bacterium]|jgi:molecular chaperone GrpE|nr:nucleotide exchange factor GrpE [Rhodanobacteraceae bacterium]